MFSKIIYNSINKNDGKFIKKFEINLIQIHIIVKNIFKMINSYFI